MYFNIITFYLTKIIEIMEKTAVKTTTKALGNKAKPPRVVRARRLTLSEINSVLYASGKTKILTPVEKNGASYTTSSKVTSSKDTIVFTKNKGIITATTNDENPQILKTKLELESFIEEL